MLTSDRLLELAELTTTELLGPRSTFPYHDIYDATVDSIMDLWMLPITNGISPLVLSSEIERLISDMDYTLSKSIALIARA